MIHATVVPEAPVVTYRHIARRPPFVWAFALGAPLPMAWVSPGEVFTVAIGDDAAGGSTDEWFDRRVSPKPAATGPIAVVGSIPGNRLEIEVIAVEPEEADFRKVPVVTVRIAGEPGDDDTGLVTVETPVGSVVRLPVTRPGGLVWFGPVLEADSFAPGGRRGTGSVRLTVRCTVDSMWTNGPWR